MFGTLLGESITRDQNSAGATALRLLLSVWILFCLTLGASYSGSLKAFLTTPGYTKPINSLEEVGRRRCSVLYLCVVGQVVESGLPWGMVLYGEEEEEMMASSPQGSAIRTIWDNKNVGSNDYHS